MNNFFRSDWSKNAREMGEFAPRVWVQGPSKNG